MGHLIISKKERLSGDDIDLSNHYRIISLLSHNSGLTITEISKLLRIARNTVVVSLARLDGAGKVEIRKVGMAKIYSLKPEVQMELEVNKT